MRSSKTMVTRTLSPKQFLMWLKKLNKIPRLKNKKFRKFLQSFQKRNTINLKKNPIQNEILLKKKSQKNLH